MIGVHDGAALESFHHTHHPRRAAGFHPDFGAGGHVTSFFESAGDAESASRGGFAFAPSEAFGRGLENGAEARVFEITQSELERLNAGHCRELIHVAFPREVVRSGREPAIGAL